MSATLRRRPVRRRRRRLARRDRRASSTPAATPTSAPVEAALRPKRLERVPRPDAGARPAAAGARGGPAPRHAARPRPALRAARPGQDDPGDDRRRRARAADPDHQRPGDPARRRPGRDPVLARPRARCSSSTRSTGCRARPRRCSTSRWRTSGSTSSSARARAPRRSRWSSPPFTVVGATTRAGLLPAPLRDRFGFTGHLDFYAADDLVTHPHRSAGLLGVDADDAGITEIARRSRGTPRIANRLLRRVRDWAQVHGRGRRRRRRPRTPRWRSSTSTTAAWTGSTGPSSRRCAAGSAGGRWVCPRWPSRWARRPTPSRPWPSRSWCARASWSARPAAGPRRRWPGSTSGLTPPSPVAGTSQAALPLGEGDGRFGGWAANITIA